ncbi:MAG TPA: GNAT family protein [Patescibacteria group bacterium]
MLGFPVPCGEIEGISLVLVPTTREHAHYFVKWVNDPETPHYGGRIRGCTEEGEERWYDDKRQDDTFILWTIMLGEEPIGLSWVTGMDQRLRTGYTGIHIGRKDLWGKGIATKVMKARSTHLFLEHNFQALFSQIFMPNVGSRTAAERAGYVQWGIRPYAGYHNGTYLDLWEGVLTRERWQQLSQ